MSYRTLMVYLQAGAENDGVLNVAGQLAQHFGARVIGISACRPATPLYEEGFAAGDVVVEDRIEIQSELGVAEARFRTVLAGKAKSLEWRSTITYGPLADYVADQAAAADLVIIGKQTGGAFFDQTRCVDVGALAMEAGRPVLLVPKDVSALSLNHAFIGWSEAREARLAVNSALPLLHAAGYATVVEAAPSGQRALAQTRVQEAASWLESHDIAATPLVLETEGGEVSSLRAELKNAQCDLLVAGAYGRNRLSEWTFGGVTNDLLLDADHCVLLAH